MVLSFYNKIESIGLCVKKVLSVFFMFLGYTMAIELGQVPPSVVIDGKNGGKVDGSAWDSSMLKGKIHTLFYVDPDKRDLNNPLADAKLAAQLLIELTEAYQRLPETLKTVYFNLH